MVLEKYGRLIYQEFFLGLVVAMKEETPRCFHLSWSMFSHLNFLGRQLGILDLAQKHTPPQTRGPNLTLGLSIQRNRISTTDSGRMCQQSQ